MFCEQLNQIPCVEMSYYYLTFLSLRVKAQGVKKAINAAIIPQIFRS